MVLTLRKPEIINLARREGKVTVDGLVTHFGVSPQTIRRDLTELADSGQLERVHGGAILPSKTVNIGYVERRELNQSSKVDIARACAKRIPNDCSVFLNLGTTTEAVATELLHHEGLLIFTNNMNIATILSKNPSIDVVVTGGNLRRSDGGLIGELAREAIHQFRYDFAVVGCSAIDPNNGEFYDFDILEVGVSKAIVNRSDRVFLIADSSKFKRKAPVHIASLADVNYVITDKELPEACMKMCGQNKTNVIIAPEKS